MTVMYQTISGRTVEVPARREPPEFPWPDLAGPLAEVVEVLMQYRDSEVDRLEKQLGAVSAVPEGLPDIAQAALRKDRELAREMLEEGRQRVAASVAEYGPSGQGFVRAMGTEPGPGQFWETLQRFAALRRPIHRYGDAALRDVQRRLLEALPLCHRLPILAEVVAPSLKARKTDPCEAMMAEYMAGPEADLRVLERGMAIPATVDALEVDVLLRLAARFRGHLAGLGGFKRSASDLSQDKPVLGHADLVPRPLPKLERDDLIRLIQSPTPAPRHEDGLVQSELNLLRLSALGAAMKELKPGAPQGGYLRASLATQPYGPWALANLMQLPQAAVWPYIAENFDILDRALGLAPASPLEPRLEPLKALDHLALLPATPARYRAPLDALAAGKNKARAARAKALLARG
ncbi:hypothetical protein [Vannielia litorea]|uniref:hypothetical protein n=1 Tax=Vannielia litorea TaxID=1217970 RepID=UPI001BCACEB5|nr:hypothetical protein [Vannielia litorea]MBS8226541.1 hypothetical protein [Vannielia litorea]